MGAPKQRWTAVEEAAFKAGIAKYGLGKWSTILKDPEFNTVLQSRSNVDLKDKWRNMNSMANALGPRYRARLPCKSNQLTSRDDGNALALGTVAENDSEAPPPAVHNETPEDAGSRTQISRLDDLILEAITKLKEPRGSSRNAIAQYMEDRQLAPPDVERKLAANLKILTEAGRLVKVKHQYRIAPSSMLIDVGKDPSVLLQEESPRLSSEVEISGIRILTRAEVDAELEAMMRMTPQEARAAAARAAAEAEAAIAAAEEAEKEAEEAEAEAEAARCFAEAAIKSLKYRTVRACNVNS
ncbi:Telomere repeat-binding factor 1 [Forsythia ovata]|uniref:MYB transcription factor n=1 Tax=Forsythia ovata TaxID=205694 RepID=A0ABD1WTN0_9LAMI